MYMGGDYIKRIPFAYVDNFYGGTEYMGRNFHKNILNDVPKLNEYLSIIIPGLTPQTDILLKWNGEIILWLHNLVEQIAMTDILKSPLLKQKLKYIIVPSEFHKQKSIEEFNIEPEKVYVIPNAIYPLQFNKEKFNKPNKIKLVHTSGLDRGMEILIDAIEYVDRDFELEIYNSFNPDFYPEYTPDPRIKFFGTTPKSTVIKAVESAHIHPYPSIYLETFCLSQVEAMSAGNLCVYSNHGALPEVSNGYGMPYDLPATREEHTKAFAEKLTLAIDTIANGEWNPEEQVKYVNETYSWENIKKQWLKFHELL